MRLCRSQIRLQPPFWKATWARQRGTWAVTIEDLKGIFQGRIKRWSDLGISIASRNENQPKEDQTNTAPSAEDQTNSAHRPLDSITVFSREKNSGTLADFQSITKFDANLKIVKQVHGQLKMAELVAENVNGIGYVSSPYKTWNSAVAIRDPATGHYGLQRKLYLYYREGTFQRRLVDWIESGHAAAIIREEGL